MIHRDIVDIMPMNQFFEKRIVFIGDAAHALTPNLAKVLAKQLKMRLFWRNASKIMPIIVKHF